MFILKSIGTFFVKIWRWIKETAWVQPLLIVGAIFAVIFSIPSITKAVQSWSKSDSNSWFLSYKVSLNNETYDGSSSDADSLTKLVYDATRYAYGEDDDASPIQKITEDYGEKFFLVYTSSSSGDNTTMANTFKFLKENWNNSGYKIDCHDDKSLPFNLKVIYTDETSDNDDDFESQNNPSAFERYLSCHTDLFNIAGPHLYEQPYRINASIDETKYDAFALNNTSSTSTTLSTDFPKPSIILCDFTQKGLDANKAGVAEIMFSLSGDTDNARAETLMNMWNHTDSYSMYPSNNFLNRD